MTDEDVAFIRENRAAREQAQAMLDQLGQGADVAKTLSDANLEDDNALNRVVGQGQGAAA